MAHTHWEFQNSIGQPDAHADPDANSNPHADSDTNANPDTNANSHANAHSHTCTKLFAVDYAFVQDCAARWWNGALYRDNHANRRIQFAGDFIRERSSRGRYRKLYPESRYQLLLSTKHNCQLFYEPWDISLHRHRPGRHSAFNAYSDSDAR